MEEYEAAATYHDGKWVVLTVDGEAAVGDLAKLWAVKRKPKKRSTNRLEGAEMAFHVGLVAPCGMDCALCLGYLRERNRCAGCRGDDDAKPRYCVTCTLKTCGRRTATARVTTASIAGGSIPAQG